MYLNGKLLYLFVKPKHIDPAFTNPVFRSTIRHLDSGQHITLTCVPRWQRDDLVLHTRQQIFGTQVDCRFAATRDLRLATCSVRVMRAPTVPARPPMLEFFIAAKAAYIGLTADAVLLIGWRDTSSSAVKCVWNTQIRHHKSLFFWCRLRLPELKSARQAALDSSTRPEGGSNERHPRPKSSSPTVLPM